MQEAGFPPGRHLVERRRFGQLRGDLADQLVRANAFADGNFERLTDGPADGLRDFHRRPARPAQLEIALVNGGLLHIRREVVGVGKHPARKALILFEVTGQNDEPGAELARPRGGHGRGDAKPAGRIRGGGDDAPLLPADGDGLAAQSRVGRLFHGGEESVRETRRLICVYESTRP